MLRDKISPMLTRYCQDCHADGGEEGGFKLESLSSDLHDEANFARWQRVFDRIRLGEMPPPDYETIPAGDVRSLVSWIEPGLHRAHAATKGTTLRRLNRREYQNTLNDLFGTDLDLESKLPEDGRAHEFDNVGEALGLSMVHMEKYLDAADAVLDAAIAKSESRPAEKTVSASYAETREGKKFIGKVWKQLDDGAVVFFQQSGYPSGMLRGTEVDPPGRYRIRVTGYAYQSDDPITFRIGGTSFRRGSEKPTYGYAQLPPNRSTTVELEADIGERYMVTIDPWGIHPSPYNIRKQGVADYTGPGLAIEKVELIGPLLDEFPSRGHQLLLSEFQITPLPRDKREKVTQFHVTADDPLAAMRATLHRIARQAFRRPVKDAELRPYLDLFTEQVQGLEERTKRDQNAKGETMIKSTGNLLPAIKTTVAAMLCSPDFLYLVEEPGKLDDHALASRLSYFLNRTMPDETLRRAAERGELMGNPEALIDHTRRLLQDPKKSRMVADFCNAWLNLRDIDFTSPDQQLFPEFDAYLRDSMVRETHAYVAKLIDDNLPATAMIQSDFAMLNERLAQHYGIDGVQGPEIRAVPLPKDSVRGGLITQASVLKVSANGTNTSPVVRGVYVMERILNDPPQPPPPGVPGVEPDIRGASTLRELLAKHRDLDSCRACHAKIDPPGFALECFNPIGGFRDRFRSLGEGERVTKEIDGRKVRYRLGPTVDASGELPDGTQFDGFQSFREQLLTQPDRLRRALLTKLATFATGREMGFSDRIELNAMTEQTSGRGVRDLIETIVLSDIFQTK